MTKIRREQLHEVVTTLRAQTRCVLARVPQISEDAEQELILQQITCNLPELATLP